jgi:uncharacterized membrane protein YhaH (DUF805 family)
MQSLVWCFFSWHGELRRREFFLAMLAIGLLGYAAGQILMDVMVTPTNNGQTWARADLMRTIALARILPFMAAAWPSLVIQAKRLRHIGMPAHSVFAAQAVLLPLLFLWPTGWNLANLAWTGFMFLAPEGLVRLARK